MGNSHKGEAMKKNTASSQQKKDDHCWGERGEGEGLSGKYPYRIVNGVGSQPILASKKGKNIVVR